MKKFMKYAPWLIAGGAIAFAVVTRQHYANKHLLEIPSLMVQGKQMLYIPPASNPLIYDLKDGVQVAVHLVEKVAESTVVAP